MVFKFTKEISEREGKDFGGFGEDAIKAMMNYPWPGNVRELKNLVEKTLLIAGSSTIHEENLLPYFEKHTSLGKSFLPVVYDESLPLRLIIEKLDSISQSLEELKEAVANLPQEPKFNLKEQEEKSIKNALEKTGGNKRKAALLLKISPKTLYRKMKKYGIPLDYAR